MRRPRFRAWPFFLPATLVICAYAGVRGYAAWQLHRAERAFEHDVGSLDYRTYPPPPVKDEDNAAIPIREAMKAFPPVEHSGKAADERRETLMLASRPPSSWTPEERTKIDALLARCERSLGLLRDAAHHRSSNMNLTYGKIAASRAEPLSTRTVPTGYSARFRRRMRTTPSPVPSLSRVHRTRRSVA